MITKKQVMLIALGACLVGLTALGSAKNPVTRPLKSHGHGTVVFNGDGTVSSTVVANWTHLGLSISIGSGYFDSQGAHASGVLTAANGDQLYWTIGEAGEPAGLTVFNGGTGRFASATGWATGEAYNTVFTYNPDGSLKTMDQDVYGEGTLTY